MLGQNLQNVVGQIMDFYLAKTYKKVLPKTVEIKYAQITNWDNIDTIQKQHYIKISLY